MEDKPGKGRNKGGRGNGKGGNTSRRSKGGGKSNPNPVDDALDGNPSNGDSSKKGGTKQEAKQAKEIQASQRVLLEGTQVMQNLQGNDTWHLVKTKVLQAITSKVQGRLTPQLVAVYTLGYDPTNASEQPTAGMDVLEKLRDVQRLLNAVADFVAALHSETATGREIWIAGRAATCDGFQPPSMLAQYALQKDLDSMAKDRDLTGMRALLRCTDDPEPNQAFNASLIPEGEQRQTFLDREITRLVAELLREEQKVPQVKELILAVLSMKLLPNESAIKPELEKLAPLLQPMNTEVIATDDLKMVLNDFRTNKSLKLYKCLNNFSTGLLILENAGKALNQRIKDASLESQISELVEDASKLVDVQSFTSFEELKEHHQSYADFFAKVTAVRSASSSELLERRETEMEEAKKPVEARGERAKVGGSKEA